MTKKITWMLRDADGAPGGVTDPPPVDPNAAPVVDPNAPPVSTDPPPVDPNAPPEDTKTVPLAAVIDERKKRQDAETQLAYYKGLAEGRGTQGTSTSTAVAPPQTPQPPTPPVEPTPEQFGDDWQAYDRAMAKFRKEDRDYIVAVTEYNLTQKFEQRLAEGQQKQTQQQVVQNFQSRLQKEAETDPEIMNIASTFHLPGPSNIPISGPMQEALLESEVGPKILRYLANNRNEAARLSSMTPASAIREIGKIEAAIINKPPEQRRISQAPEPPTPVPGSTGAAVVLNPSQADWITERNKRDFGR